MANGQSIEFAKRSNDVKKMNDRLGSIVSLLVLPFSRDETFPSRALIRN